jgi:vacuolar protein sorting-associated protein 35
LLVSLIKLSLSCYPEKFDYVDQILAYTKDKVLELTDSPDLHARSTESNLLSLLLAPVQQYSSPLILLALSNYNALLSLQPYATRQQIAEEIIHQLLKNDIFIDIPEDVHGILDLCSVLLRDQKDAPIVPPVPVYTRRQKKPLELSVEQEDYVEKQGLLARVIHLFKSDDEDTQFLVS